MTRRGFFGAVAGVFLAAKGGNLQPVPAAVGVSQMQAAADWLQELGMIGPWRNLCNVVPVEDFRSNRRIPPIQPGEAVYQIGEIYGVQALRFSRVLPGQEEPAWTYTCSHCGVPFAVGGDCGCGAKRPAAVKAADLQPLPRERR